MNRAFLRIVAGPRKGVSIPLHPDQPLLVGRNRGDLVLDDPLVSAVHCRVLSRDGRFVVQDLGSTNGTLVDGRLVTDAALAPGSELVVGGSRLVLFLAEEETAPPPSDGIDAGLEIAWLLDEELHHPDDAPSVPLMGQGLRLPPGVEASVEVVSGVDAGRIWRLTRGTATIGRRAVEVPLNDTEVSRRHAIVEVFGREMVFVRDAASTNGTYNNGRRVLVARIADGDTIGIGKSVLKVRCLPAGP